ncbi:MAG: dTDP-4-dehydrorhamnose 3,5-epimerase [Proteobacteria bacterium]|nr:dTDP-4-dehydrorhamnose 3,5-epimerase [Pseudomonadota bacterium]
MTLKFTEQSLPGVILIEPAVFKDDRGFFMETYHVGKYREAGIDPDFVQDNLSHSRRFTLRGLHYQLKHPQSKLIYVIAGEVLDIAVDIRRGSPMFGRWTGTLLSDKNKCQLFIPAGFAHGFCVLSETADVIYKCTDLYASGDEYGILWSDPTINIVWPIENPIFSEKDAKYPALKDVPEEHLPLYKQ